MSEKGCGRIEKFEWYNTDSFPGTAAAASAAGFDAIFFEICIIRMAWARVQVGLGVIVWPLIFVFYEEPDWSS